MAPVVHLVVLALDVLGLAHAALRASSRLAERGLERAVVACVFGVGAAVIETLALGLIGLGGSTVALTAATLLTWGAAYVLLPTPAVSAGAELLGWWGWLGIAARIVAAVLGGAFLGWVAWQLRHPSIGFDSALYHYPEVADWIASGHPGSMLTLSYDIPYGNYPLTDEVAMTWATAIARSWLPIALWTPALLTVLAGATWLTLRNLSVSRAATALGTATLVAMPLVVHELNEPQTDVPALAWLACTAALATSARRRPALLMPAVVAGGLALGTKTSTGPMVVAALCVGLFLARDHLRALAGWLGLALAAAFVIGGVWYARNLLQHGSPFWPFTAAPWGDKSPRFFAALDTPFIARPVATLSGRLGAYASRLGGGWILLAATAAVLAYAVFARRLEQRLRRPLLIAGAVALVGVLAWSTAWGTGLPTAAGVPGPAGWPLSTVRYLLPALGACVVAVGLATRVPGLRGRLAIAVFVVALVWSVVADARLGQPYTPSARVLVAAAAAGLLCLAGSVAAGRLLARRTRRKLLPAGAPAILAAAVLAAALAPVGNGFVARYTRVTGSTAPGADVVAWFVSQPRFEHGHGAVAFASRAVLGPLAGDHFAHRLTLVPARSKCASLVRLAARTPVVVTVPGFFSGILGVNAYDAPRCLAHLRPVYQHGTYKVYWRG